MNWTPQAATRLRMNWCDLAEMHLLLREHGWEAEPVEIGGWIWKHPGQRLPILTFAETSVIEKKAWRFLGDPSRRESTSVATLKRKLKELAK